MKITNLSILCKWKKQKNRQCIKYLFAPMYIATDKQDCLGSVLILGGGEASSLRSSDS